MTASLKGISIKSIKDTTMTKPTLIYEYETKYVVHQKKKKSQVATR